ncbi:hypothetical protein ACNKHV_18800 [Shigella flexneri]
MAENAGGVHCLKGLTVHNLLKIEVKRWMARCYARIGCAGFAWL